MIDEYQDFSLPFFRLVQALRTLYPELKLFAVGDDWQAINRFAGSDTPCYKTGMCAHCATTNSVCAQLLRTRVCRPAGRIKVILVGENLGY